MAVRVLYGRRDGFSPMISHSEGFSFRVRSSLRTSQLSPPSVVRKTLLPPRYMTSGSWGEMRRGLFQLNR